MQLPILSGVYTDQTPDIRTSYPINMVPVGNQSGISEGYLRPADGIVETGTGPGIGRGGINWRGVIYRVMGTKLCRELANGTLQVIGDVGGTGQVSMSYGPVYLAIASGGQLYLYDGGTLARVTDPDLGTALDVVWVDGYFMTTDGEFLVVTELGDPFSVNPLRYGTAEADPDPVRGLAKIRNEVYAVGQYTVEVFDNIGGSVFPFQRIEGAQIQRGAVGTHAFAVYMEQLAFVGGAENEPASVWLGANGTAAKISTREIDQILQALTTGQLEAVSLEVRHDQGHMFLDIHLPDRTLVYDAAMTATMGTPIWFQLRSQTDYRARHAVWCYDRWSVCDTQQPRVGRLDNTLSSHWGDVVDWQFGTVILYNAGAGAIVHTLELVALTGSVAFGADPRVWTEYSVDGQLWSQRRYISAGKRGDRQKRLIWFHQGPMRHWRVQRFGGNSDAHLAFARLEANVEGLMN